MNNIIITCQQIVMSGKCAGRIDNTPGNRTTLKNVNKRNFCFKNPDGAIGATMDNGKTEILEELSRVPDMAFHHTALIKEEVKW